MADEKSIPRRKRQYRNSQRAIEYLLGYPAASNEQVVKATGCSARSVSRARSMLVATGQLSRSYYDRQGTITGPNEAPQEGSSEPTGGLLPVEGVKDPAGLEKALRIDHGPPLTNDQMRLRYSAIARYAQKTGEFNLEMSAMQAFARLEASTGARNRLGPGVPLTRDDKKDRVVPILQACGPDLVAESTVTAFTASELVTFLTQFQGYSARKERDEQRAEEDRSIEGKEGAEGGKIAPESVTSSTSEPRGGVDGGAPDPTAGGSGGTTDS